MTFSFAVWCAVSSAQLRVSEAEGANILYIVVDDHGHTDIGYHARETSIDTGSAPTTPRMDGFAMEGVRLESFYTQPICAASRSSIMTGRYVHKYGFQHFNPPKGIGGVGAIPLSEKVLPEFMKDNGYETHMVGKWHCGMIKKAYLPQNRGFDTHFGYYEGAIDYYTHRVGPFLDLHNATGNGEQQCVRQARGTYDLELWTHRLGEVLNQHDADRGPPLFVYMAPHSVHDPDEVPQEWFDMYPNVTETKDHRRTMHGMVSAMDAGIGTMVDLWRSHGEVFWNNSLVLFHSDNGGATYEGAGALNYPLRGGKLTLFEGGMRVNAWAYGPLIEKPGRVHSGLMHITDVLPTLVGLAGGRGDGGMPLDGMDLWAAWSRGEASPRSEIVHLIDPFGNGETLNFRGCEVTGEAGTCQNSSSLRQGDWKLIVGMFAACQERAEAGGVDAERFCNWFRYKGGDQGRKHSGGQRVAWNRYGEPVALYNIATDREERNNVATDQPAIVQRMMARLDEVRSAEWHEPQWAGTNACDTPDGSCKMRRVAYAIAAAKKGCVNPFIADTHSEHEETEFLI